MISYKLPRQIVQSFLTLEVHSNSLIVTSGEFFINVDYNEVTWQLYENNSSSGQYLLNIKPFYTSTPKDYQHETICRTYHKRAGDFQFDQLFRMPKNEFGFIAIRLYRAGVSEDAMGRLFPLDGVTFIHENELAIQIEETHHGLQADIMIVGGIV